MGLFTRQEHDRIGRLHYILKLAFERIKGDMHNLFHWVHYFNQKHQEHEERFSKLENSINFQPQNITKEEIRQMIEIHYPTDRIEKIYNRMQDIHERMDKLESKSPTPRVALKERLLKKINKNSKEYIKSVILGTLKKYGRIQGPQLKEIIVEEQGICSKSSFYRLLQEIEQEHEIASFLDGKEKTFFIKTEITN